MPSVSSSLLKSFREPTHIAPLAIFRIAFGALMFMSTIRFFLKGWIADFYITPKFYFPYYGFEWVTPLDADGMYVVFVLMALSSLMIMVGLFYRLSSIVFFFSFAYVELLDKTYYLNHYYLISIIAFLMMLVPAQRYFSFDALRNPDIEVSRVPGWTINIFKLQLCLTYFFAGISKINYNWLIYKQGQRH